ncbi:hypothetical protein L198_01234 [Cryptococcus wingfieldii CBS 7118]|uniref:Peptidase C19 ubiquitin carboxyl-terminal hydrolase domain-containing protein n=1 Tax=Cryptococcus wingfieldii CBS 7118 TaxID=1295528 RepID=A0A1E3K498_9TREE|nr:hypothetical protein L198_01234 [Cryptococcus wingfieldii CBS 7118]ODO07653.1 hypothetical protein L198_01234 [Cryptococcus wingfieldii CBS 7118]
MSASSETLESLLAMGIEPVLAREASSRFHTADAAVNWCFGDGADWKPEVARDAAPGYSTSFNPRHSEGTFIQHREVVDVADSPAASPKPSQSQFASNNPFRTSPSVPARPTTSTTLAAPGSSAREAISVDDEDDQLKKAIALSQGQGQGQEGRGRGRADGPPPPSPSGGVGAEPDIAPLFGPSTKEDTGNMSLVPSGQNDHGRSKEDAEMDKAIMDSLMTASFHSASAQQEKDKPVPKQREEGAPVVFYSESGKYTPLAHILQAYGAIRELREIYHRVALPTSDGVVEPRIESLAGLFDKNDLDAQSYTDADGAIKSAKNGASVTLLPPLGSALGTFLPGPYCVYPDDLAEFHEMLADEFSLHIKVKTLETFETTLTSAQTSQASYVQLRKGPGGYDIYTQLGNLFWPPSSSSSEDMGLSIIEPADILFVGLGYAAEAKMGELWKLDKEVVLDRFLERNKLWAANRRGLQGVAEGDLRRGEEKMEKLLKHEHLDTTITSSKSSRAQSQQILRDKVSTVYEALKARRESLEVELEGHRKAASAGAFDTDDPEYLQHVYDLKAVLFHDGALVGNDHLYVYVKGDDGRWWKIKEHECTQVSWEAIRDDRTGIWMEGGPYALVYVRTSPRPPSPSSSTAANDTTTSTQPQSTLQADIPSENSSTDSLGLSLGESAPTPSALSEGGKEEKEEQLVDFGDDTPPVEGKGDEKGGNEDLVDIVMGEERDGFKLGEGGKWTLLGKAGEKDEEEVGRKEEKSAGAEAADDDTLMS